MSDEDLQRYLSGHWAASGNVILRVDADTASASNSRLSPTGSDDAYPSIA